MITVYTTEVESVGDPVVFGKPTLTFREALSAVKTELTIELLDLGENYPIKLTATRDGARFKAEVFYSGSLTRFYITKHIL